MIYDVEETSYRRVSCAREGGNVLGSARGLQEGRLADGALDVHRLRILHVRPHVNVRDSDRGGVDGEIGIGASYDFQLRLGRLAILRVALALLLSLGSLDR